MKIILINIAIIVGSLIIWFGNHYFEERELNEINQEIEEEKRYHEDFINKTRTAKSKEQHGGISR